MNEQDKPIGDLVPLEELSPENQMLELEHGKPILPEAEVERQARWKLSKAVGHGEDEIGKYDVVPLSNLVGGAKKDKRVYLHPAPHLVSKSAPSPRGWYKDKHSPDKVRPRPCYSEAMLTTPYTGYCNVGCAFCYIDHGVRGYKGTGLALANIDYAQQMDEWLSKMLVVGPAYISSFTEPFQAPLENELEVTKRLSDVFVKHGIPIFYLSRRLPPAWALEVLKQNPYSYMQWSVNTSNEDDYKRLSPGSYRVHKLMQEVRKFRDAGVYTSFQCNPILPGIMELGDIVKLVHMLAEAGGNHIIFKFVEQVASNRKLLFSRLEERNFEKRKLDELDGLLSQFIGGVYTIQEATRRQWLDVLLMETRKANITMSTCYEYYNNGKAGANMAPWYTTADQCHGRSVPMFVRNNLNEPFQPLPGCYRKGCLYCEEHGTKACQSDVLLKAKALEYGDMRTTKAHIDPANWNLPESAPRPGSMSIDMWPARNPGLMTDAQLWNLGPLPPVLASHTRPASEGKEESSE